MVITSSLKARVISIIDFHFHFLNLFTFLIRIKSWTVESRFQVFSHFQVFVNCSLVSLTILDKFLSFSNPKSALEGLWYNYGI